MRAKEEDRHTTAVDLAPVVDASSPVDAAVP